jgi:hypothetical protein
MTRYKMINGELVEYTAEEEKARDAREKAWADGQADRDLVDLREQRDALLKDTDWTANSDVTMSDEMRTYRQALRDITNTYQSMNDDGFAFPTKPTE